MFCCTLIALIFSQPALAYGAVKARVHSNGAAVGADATRQWRIPAMFGLLGIDAVLLISGIHFLQIYGTEPIRAICGLAP